MSKLVATTNKSYGPRAGINWLLGPMLRAESTGNTRKGLLWKHYLEDDDATVHDAPKGYYPETYIVVPDPFELDPTCEMALTTRMYEESDSSVASVGLSSIWAEKDGQKIVSLQFGEWVARWEILAQRALAAEKALNSGNRRKLSRNGEVYEYDGAIMAFLAATGELVGSEFGMHEHDLVEVQPIINQASVLIKNVISACDHKMYEKGRAETLSAIGSATLPHDGTAATFIGAESFEKLFESPFKLVMRNKLARRYYKDILRTRIPDFGVFGIANDYVFSEGMDMVVIPGAMLADSENFDQLWDHMTNAIDTVMIRGLTQADYDRNTITFTDQFFTKGDLVESIFVTRSVTPWAPSNLSVAVTPLVTEDRGPQPNTLNLSHLVPGTGGMGSIDIVRNGFFNVISGMDPYYADVNSGVMDGGADLSLTFQLPNRILDITSPANATLLNWTRFLRWYGKTFSGELNQLNAATGSARADYKFSSSTVLDGGAQQIAKIISDSQRNGVSAKMYGSFATHKADKVGQQGPVLQDTSMGGIGPALISGLNEWTRADISTVRVVDFKGRRIMNSTEDQSICSSFTGEAQGGIAPSPLHHPNIASTGVFGGADASLSVAAALASIPLEMDGQSMLPTTMGRPGSRAWNDAFTDVGEFHGGSEIFSAKDVFYRNLHPTEGFKRGFVQIATMGNYNAASSMIARLEGWARESSNSMAFPWNANGAADKIRINQPLAWANANIDQTTGVGSAPFPSSGTDFHGYIKHSISLGKDYRYDQYADPMNGENTPRCVWYWDPSRTDAIGYGTRLFYGNSYSDVCFSAVQSYAPEVAVGAIRLRDLQSDRMSHQTPCKATLMPMDNNTGVRWSDMQGIGLAYQSDKAVLDGRLEQDEGSYPHVIVPNRWRDRLDIVSEIAAELHDGSYGVGGLTGSIYIQTQTQPIQGANPGSPALSIATSGYIDSLSVHRRNFSMTNGCSPTTFNRLSLLTLNSASGVACSQVGFAIGQNLGSLPGHDFFFDGPAQVPINNDVNVLMIQGNGLCSYGSMAHHPYDVTMQALITMKGIDEPFDSISYPLSALASHRTSPGYGDREKTSSVLPAIPQISASMSNVAGANFIVAGSGDATSMDPWFALPEVTNTLFGYIQGLSTLSVELPYHPLLTARRDPEAKHELTLTNPWIRGESKGYGHERLKYSHTEATNLIIDDIVAKLILDGLNARAPFTNELFRDIQTQGR